MISMEVVRTVPSRLGGGSDTAGNGPAFPYTDVIRNNTFITKPFLDG